MKKSLILVLLTILIFIFLFLNLEKIIKRLENKNLHFLILDKFSEKIDFDFKLIKSEEVIQKNKILNYKIFTNKLLRYRFYLGHNKENVFLISKEGNIFYISKKNLLSRTNFELKRIKTNISELIGYDYILNYRSIIKGILIDQDEIFVSYIANNNGCFFNSIINAKINLSKINFTNFFEIKECRKIFNYSVGGNIEKFKNNKIILTTGDFQIPENIDENEFIQDINQPKKDNLSDPQNQTSYFGKILSIDRSNKNTEIISIGHRNPQGLFYDFENDIVFSTDHGPKGGDEINVHEKPQKKIVKNFGWPKVSYGVRYEEEANFIDEDCNNKVLTKIAPLCKSHIKYGFDEPIKYFTPSIGITQILKINNKSHVHELFVASMGYDKDEDDMTLHLLKFNKFFKEIEHSKFYIGERIRDIIFLDKNFFLISLESLPSPSFALIKLN